jgi:hypothetical protein
MNTPSSIVVRLEGRVMDFNEKQNEKAPSLSVVTPSGMLMVVRSVFASNNMVPSGERIKGEDVVFVMFMNPQNYNMYDLIISFNFIHSQEDEALYFQKTLEMVLKNGYNMYIH